MKTDIWRTQSTSPNQCPLCNKQLKEGSKTCFSCGFSMEPPPGSSVWIDPTVYRFQPSDASEARKSSGGISDLPRSSPRSKKQANPITPIPPRASAQRSGGMKALPDGQTSRQLSTPPNRQSRSTIPLGRREISTPKPSQPIIWQYESQNFEAGSSLPSLSLLVPELPTEPGVLPDEIEEQSPVPPTSQHLSHVDEIDTLPAHLVAPQAKTVQRDPSSAQTVDEIDSRPSLQEASHRQLPVPPSKAVIPLAQKQEVVEIGSMPSQSWTAGGSTESYYAQYIASRGKKRRHQGLSLNPIDRVRWWLLRPGRLEFIMWLGGTILLITVTCVLLLVSALSFNWITPNTQGNTTTNPSTDSTRTHPLPTVTTTPGLALKLLDKGPLLPGQSFRVYGEGFSPHSRIAFTFDGMEPLLNANGQPSTTMTDAQGAFTFTIHIGDGPQWATGEHLLIARDIAANRVAALYFTIAPVPFGKAVTPTPSMNKNTPAPGSGGGPGVGVTATPTQTQGNPGSTPTPIPTPVNQTPVVPSPTPTHGITPTPTPPPPTPTPTKTTTPTPTPGVTPTVKPSPTASASVVTPTASPTSSSSNSLLSNALSDEPALKTPLANLSPLAWLMIGCYSVGMLLLGIAGVLHKRRK